MMKSLMEIPQLSVPALRAFLSSKGEVLDGQTAWDPRSKRSLLNTLLISAHDGHDMRYDDHGLNAAIKREDAMINEAIAFLESPAGKRGKQREERLAYARSFGLLPPTDGS